MCAQACNAGLIGFRIYSKKKKIKNVSLFSFVLRLNGFTGSKIFHLIAKKIIQIDY